MAGYSHGSPNRLKETDRMTDRSNKPILEVAKLTPKVFAQKCPVCNGFGTLSFGKVDCHGCDGKGWIVLNNELGESQ